MINTVLFDLDDTIYDHKYSRLCGLNILIKNHAILSKVPIEELEMEHEKILLGNYNHVLDGSLSIENSRLMRTYMLFKKYGINLTNDEAITYTNNYREEYHRNQRAIPGLYELMSLLHGSVKIGIVSNGINEIQVEKIKICGITNLIDFMIFSEDIQVRKPNREIFKAAIDKAASNYEQTVFIGDSWASDIIGASNCGIKTIWLNRYNQICPDKNLTFEINSYADPQSILDKIFCR